MIIAKKRTTTTQAGSSLIEVLIATMVVALVMIALSTALAVSVRNTAQSKYRALATSRAQERLEIFRRARATLGWASFAEEVTGGEYCLNEVPSSSADLSDFLAARAQACESGVEVAGTGLTHDVSILQNVSGSEVVDISVEVTVGWVDGNQDHAVVVEQIFRNIE